MYGSDFPGGDRMAKPFGIQLKGVRVGLHSGLNRSLFALLGRNLVQMSFLLSLFLFISSHLPRD